MKNVLETMMTTSTKNVPFIALKDSALREIIILYALNDLHIKRIHRAIVPNVFSTNVVYVFICV